MGAGLTARSKVKGIYQAGECASSEFINPAFVLCISEDNHIEESIIRLCSFLQAQRHQGEETEGVVWSRSAFRAHLDGEWGQVSEQRGSENMSDCVHAHPSALGSAPLPFSTSCQSHSFFKT